MTSLSLTEVVASLRGLPALPAVAMELLASMDDDDVDIDALARKIAQDQALTASTLRLANSSFYGMAGQVTTVGDAIAILGFRSVRGVATTAALAGAFRQPAHGSFHFITFWRHSLATALCARELASHLALNTEHAYTVGLLHDIGRLVLATRFQDDFERVLAHRARDDCTLLAAEREVLQLDHAQIGSALAEHWRFPPAMQLAVAEHHQPQTGAGHQLSWVILVADAIAHALDLAGDEDDLVPSLPGSAWEQLGLDERAIDAAMRATEAQFEGARLMLEAA